MTEILNHLTETARARSGDIGEVYLQESCFADFIAAASDGLIKYSSAWGWLVYEDATGVFISDERAGKIVRLYIEEMAKELMKASWSMPESERREGIMKFGVKIMTARGVKNIEQLLKDRECLHADAGGFDLNATLINCKGIAVNLQTGEQRPAGPGDLFMKSAGFRPFAGSVQDAIDAAPTFVQFIKDITLQKRDVSDYLLSFLGYSLTGDMREQCYLNFWGAQGANGKSTLLNLLRLIWADYAVEAPESVVLKTKTDSRFDMQFIVGARLVIKADIVEGAWLNNENIKKLTGGDAAFHAEKKYHDGFGFAPLCKVILSSNGRLRLSETGDAVERRVRLMPFRANFRANPDKTIPDRLAAEATAILTILIHYAKKWYAEGLPVSETVVATSSEYILDEDIVRQFIAEKCVRGDGEAVPQAELYAAFCAWLKLNKPPSAKSFKDKMMSRGYDCKKYTKSGPYRFQRCFFGLRILGEFEKKPEEQAELFVQDPALNQDKHSNDVYKSIQEDYFDEEIIRKCANVPEITPFSDNFNKGVNIKSPEKQGKFWHIGTSGNQSKLPANINLIFEDDYDST